MGLIRQKAIWRVCGEEITLGVKTWVTARINLVPESGNSTQRPDPSAILEQCFELEELGADIIEINASSRNPAIALSMYREETARLVPVIRKLGNQLHAPVSVATIHSSTARRAIELGASIIHDISGLIFDNSLAKEVNKSNVGLVLGHMRGTPDQWSSQPGIDQLTTTVSKEMRASLLRANHSGIEPRRIVLDPGLEQGKRGHENLELLRSLKRLVPQGQGIQATLSGKRFLYESAHDTEERKHAADCVAATLAIEAGAHILGIDNPESLRDVIAVFDRIYKANEVASMGANEIASLKANEIASVENYKSQQ